MTLRRVNHPRHASILVGCTARGHATRTRKREKGMNRGQNFKHKHFSLKLFGCPWHIPAKSRADPPKSLFSPGCEGHAELFGPHPFTWKTPTPPEDVRTQKFGFVLLFPPRKKDQKKSRKNRERNSPAQDVPHIAHTYGQPASVT